MPRMEVAIARVRCDCGGQYLAEPDSSPQVVACNLCREPAAVEAIAAHAPEGWSVRFTPGGVLCLVLPAKVSP